MENTLSAINRRTMLVVWSWRQGGLPDDRTTWTVTGSRRDLDRLVCVDRPRSAENELWLREAIRQHAADGDVFVFLHRRHGYDQAAIQRLIPTTTDRAAEVRCFLFGEGSDAIYLAQSDRGLLGTAGTFSGRFQRQGHSERQLSAVADATQQLLQSTNFEYVWRFYQGAFKARIFELKEDLFSVLAELATGSSLAPGTLYNFLKQPAHKVLLLRLLSFTGRLRSGSTLEKQLLQAEESTGRQFRFDDCGANLAAAYGPAAAGQYQDVATLISRDALAKGQELELVDLRAGFADLLAIMPGETYG